jgi:hypothetical protein
MGSLGNPHFMSVAVWPLLLIVVAFGGLLATTEGTMPPSNRPIYDSGLESVGKGFWFALGFTPVFVVICFFASIIIDHFESNGYFSIQWPFTTRIDTQIARALDRSVHSVPVQQPVVIRVPAPAPAPVARVNDADMSQAKQQERECSALVLQFSETQDPAIKKRIYEVCPK